MTGSITVQCCVLTACLATTLTALSNEDKAPPAASEFESSKRVALVYAVPRHSAGGPMDSDGDGVTDDIDNCTVVSNTQQIDADEDGIGNRCDPDFDNNCSVNFQDIIRYASIFNAVIGDPNYDPIVDIDSNGSIGFLDYIAITANFLGPPGPSAQECVP